MSMNMKTLAPWSVVALGCLGMAVTLTADDPRAAFHGVWRTVEVTVPGPTPQTFRPTATIAIFHGKHYSRTEVHAEQERPMLKNPAVATADELRAIWGPFVGEAGTFDVTSPNVVTMQANVAKNPAAMIDGAVSVFTYERRGDTLTLTQLRTSAGPRANPVTIKLTRID